MIVLEIRNNELRITKTKNNKILKFDSMNIDNKIITDLMNEGNSKPLSDSISTLLDEWDNKAKKDSFTVLLNLEQIMTHKNTLPKLRDKELAYAVHSTLLRDRVLISNKSTMAYSVLRKPKSKTPKKKVDKEVVRNKKGKVVRKQKEIIKTEVLSYVLEKKAVELLIEMFEKLNIKLKYIDVLPNALIKSFQNSKHNNNKYKLNLVIDLSDDNIIYYQFKDKIYSFKYLDKIGSNELHYLDTIESNIYQFLDEYSEYTLDDLNILLMGEDVIVKKVLLNFQGIFNITRYSNGIKNAGKIPSTQVDKYIGNLGATIRNDRLLSVHSKYDVNLMNADDPLEVNNNVFKIRVAAILSALIVVSAIGYLSLLQISNNRLSAQNDKLGELIATLDDNQIDEDGEPVDNKPQNYVETLEVYEKTLDKLLDVENYLTDAKLPYNSEVYSILMLSAPSTGEVNNISYNNGLVEINYSTLVESDFKDYILELQESGYFKSVNYKGYTLTGDKYIGTILVDVGKGGIE